MTISVTRRRLTIVGGAFTPRFLPPSSSSVHGKKSRFIQWVRSGGQATFYMDRAFNVAFQDKRPFPKYLWLAESAGIVPGLIEDVKSNLSQINSVFDLVFTHDKSMLVLGEKFKWVPAAGTWIKSPFMYPKTRLVSMITSNKSLCPGHLSRLEWAHSLKDRLDLYGRGFSPIRHKEYGLCPYMFSVAIENSLYKGYFTEKVLDCFATGTVPLYLGAEDVSSYFDSSGIIPLTNSCVDDLGPDLYYSMLPAIKSNLAKVKSLPIPEDYIWLNYLS